jgi:DNA-binding GntR family transcriptional regulator
MKNLGQEHANLDQQAYRIIKKMIRDRQLLPGDKIPQESLAQELIGFHASLRPNLY